MLDVFRFHHHHHHRLHHHLHHLLEMFVVLLAETVLILEEIGYLRLLAVPMATVVTLLHRHRHQV
jgi:hypothetical protein